MSGHEALSDPQVQPEVIFTYPTDGTTGLFNLYNHVDGKAMPHFVVRFNKLMRKQSITSGTVVCQGFRRPVIVGLYRTDELFQKTSGADRSMDADDLYSDLLAFTVYDSVNPDQKMSFDVQQTYTVRIDTTLEDINGNHLSWPFTFSFMPEPFFRVLSITPDSGSTDVDIETSPTIIFNSRVDASVFPAIQSSPEANGRWIIESIDSFHVSFQLRAFLAYKSTYSFVVTTSAHDVYQHFLQTQTGTSFKTNPFTVASASPADGAKGISPASRFTAVFTGPFDSSTVRPAFSIQPTAAGTVIFTTPRSFEFIPTDGLIPDTSYTVTLGDRIRSTGITYLGTDHTYGFTTDQFRVRSTYPSDGAYDISRSASIIVSMNATIDTGTVRRAFIVEPPVRGTFYLYDGNDSFTYVPSELLDANTTYTIILTEVLKTKTGYIFPRFYSFTFTTTF